MGVITDAGILKDGKLSDPAKTKFIKEVKDELIVGTAGMPVPVFPCGPTIPAFPFAEMLELEDEKKYPEFHKNVLGQYQQIAIALDAEGKFSFLPICCPVSLAFALGVDAPQLKFPSDFLIYSFALPLLAIKLGFALPVDLVAKFPKLIVPPIPSISIPKLGFDPNVFPELFEFNASLAGIPPAMLKVMLEMITQMPKLLTGILSFDFKPFCDVVLKSQMFGPFDPNTALTWVVAQKVLARKVAEMLLLNLVGTTMGSSPAGLVGGLGSYLGYTPPPPKGKFATLNPRQSIIKSLSSVKGSSWSEDQKTIENNPPDKLSLKYTSYLLPQEVDDGKNGKATTTHIKVKNLDTKTLFARGALLRGGASDKYFTDKFSSSNIDKLASLASSAGAKINITRSSFPGLKAGDIIMCDHVSIVVTKDRSGSRAADVEGMVGGLPDSDNDDKRTKIGQRTLKCSIDGENIILSAGSNVYVVKYAVDSEKLVKNE